MTINEKTLAITNYIILDGGYVNESGIKTNFLLRVLGVKMEQKGTRWLRNYILEVAMVNGNQHEMTVTSKKMNSGKWIEDIPEAIAAGNWRNRKNFSEKVSDAVVNLGELPILESVTERSGYELVKGIPVFTFSNGAITGHGFIKSIHAANQTNGFGGKLPSTELQRQQLFIEAMTPMSKNMKVLYPVWLINLMSAFREPLRQLGIPLKMVLWLDGERGSGKTEIAKTIGCMTVVNEFKEKEVVSATEQVNILVKKLTESKGISIILDDVKKEKSQRQKNKRFDVVDVLLRSVYQGCTTENSRTGINDVSTCAIVTGEYMDNSKSQNARLLYQNISGFLMSLENSKILATYQSNQMLLSSLWGDLIRWFLQKFQEESFTEDIKLQWKILQQGRKESLLPDYNRLFDAECSMRICGYLFYCYIGDQGLYEISQELQLFEKANEAIENLVESTSLLQNGLETVVMKAVKEIMMEVEVAEAVYKYQSGMSVYKYRQAEFALQDDEMFLWIPEWLKSEETRRSSEGNNEQDSILIVDAMKLLDMIHEKLIGYAERGEIPMGYIAKVTPLLLAKMRLIYVARRDDDHFRYSRDYPKVMWQYSYNCAEPSEIQMVGCWQCNLKHPCFAKMQKKKRCYNGYENDLSDIDNQRIFNIRKKFVLGKFLCNQR